MLPKDGSADDYLDAYIPHLRGRAAGHVSADGLDLTAERARLAKEQADKLSRENALARGELIYRGEVEGWLVPFHSAIAQRIGALPAKAAPEAHGTETIAECEAVLKRYTDEIREDIAEARWIDPVPERPALESEPDYGGRLSPSEAADGQHLG